MAIRKVLDMAHTYRDILNHQRRERIRGWSPGEYYDYSDPLNRYPRLRGGNMVMAPSASGIRDDERAQDAAGRRRQRRNQKRRERQGWKREAASEALPESLEPEADSCDRPDYYDLYMEWIEYDLEYDLERYGSTDDAGDYVDDLYDRW